MLGTLSSKCIHCWSGGNVRHRNCHQNVFTVGVVAMLAQELSSKCIHCWGGGNVRHRNCHQNVFIVVFVGSLRHHWHSSNVVMH